MRRCNGLTVTTSPRTRAHQLEPWLPGLSGLSSIVGSCRALSGPCRAPVGLTLLTTVKQLSGTVGHVGAKVGCDHACVLSGTVGLSGCRAVGHVGACRGMSGMSRLSGVNV